MPKSVFVIDDSATMRKVFEMTFAGEDIAVVTHESADGAVSRAKELRPNAIIVDVNLPGSNSYDLVKSLRGEPNLSAVPVYILYSDHSPLDEAAARAAGAQGAVLKPFDSQAMIDRVRQSVAAAPPSPSPAGPSATPPATATPTASAARPPAPPLPSAAKPPAAPGSLSRAGIPAAAPRPTAPLVPLRPAPEAEPEAPKASVRPAPPVEPVATPTPVIPVQAADLAKSVAEQVAAKTASLGLTPQQAEAITALTREVVERVVWEVVPTLAETIIREEIKRLTAP